MCLHIFSYGGLDILAQFLRAARAAAAAERDFRAIERWVYLDDTSQPPDPLTSNRVERREKVDKLWNYNFPFPGSRSRLRYE